MEVTAWGASVATSNWSSNLDLTLSTLFDKESRPSFVPLLLPRKRFPRSMVTYCKFRTVLSRQLYKAWCIIDLYKVRKKINIFLQIYRLCVVRKSSRNNYSENNFFPKTHLKNSIVFYIIFFVLLTCTLLLT